MSPAEKELLEFAYKNYLTNKSLDCTYICVNSDKKFFMSEAAEYLEEDDYIDNYKSLFTELQFRLTGKGLKYAIKNFENPKAEH